jgi:hypothetical protein
MDIPERFLNYLYSQFRDSPVLRDFWDALMAPMIDTINTCEYILAHHGIDNAEGEFLDSWGHLIGVERPVLQESEIFTLCSEGEPDDTYIRRGFYDSESDSGGYITTEEGLQSVGNPDQYMGDIDFRKLIKTKAATYRRKATQSVLWNYLIEFGVQSLINEDEWTINLELLNYNDIGEWTKNYILTRGYKPAGIGLRITENVTENLT